MQDKFYPQGLREGWAEALDAIIIIAQGNFDDLYNHHPEPGRTDYIAGVMATWLAIRMNAESLKEKGLPR